MVSEAQAKASTRYIKQLRGFSLRLHPDRDAEVIARLDSMPNKTEYIRGLIQEDIEIEKEVNGRMAKIEQNMTGSSLS